MAFSIRSLASEIAKVEGKKSQVSIGNIREVLRILVEFEFGGLGKSKPSYIIATAADIRWAKLTIKQATKGAKSVQRRPKTRNAK